MGHSQDPRLLAARPRLATEADLDRVALTLADAFRDDPQFQWFLRRDGRQGRALLEFFGWILRSMTFPNGQIWMSEGGEVVACWFRPGALPPPSRGLGQLALLPMMLGVSGWSRLPRAAAMANLMERSHPHEPAHWYLQFIGVAAENRGQGLGTILLEHTLRAIDAEAAPAYLENSNERNLRLYERLGFRVMDIVRARSDAPPMWLMWRDPF